ncbi:MAG: hydrogenase expression/formation protein HypE [Clostridium sp.]
MSVVKLSHGSGGEESEKLIHSIFYKNFNNPILLQRNDASVIGNIQGKIAVTTDSFVVDPIFFPGGDIGHLSICGTINDLCVSGARPIAITVGFIIEEGFPLDELNKIAKSMGETARDNGVNIVAGDTKVVGRGMCHRIFINTTGIGVIKDNIDLDPMKINIGDKIILSGSIGDHGMCILNERESLLSNSSILSDAASIYELTSNLLESGIRVRFMRDPTRGGVAQVLNEIASITQKGIVINEEDIIVKKDVGSLCSILGIDPLYVANEGKLIAIVNEEDASRAVDIMRKSPLGVDSSIIGEVSSTVKRDVYIRTLLGGLKRLPMMTGEILPRIC